MKLFTFISLCIAHFEEVKQIVNKAIKDLSIEQTLKTYEEIWLSKVFSLMPYTINKFDTEAITTHDDDVIAHFSSSFFFCSFLFQKIFITDNLIQLKAKSSHDRRSSQSRMGMMQAQSIAAKSTKRLSIGSLPQSLANIEPFNVHLP